MNCYMKDAEHASPEWRHSPPFSEADCRHALDNYSRASRVPDEASATRRAMEHLTAAVDRLTAMLTPYSGPLVIPTPDEIDRYGRPGC